MYSLSVLFKPSLVIIKYIYNPLLIDVLVGYGVVVAQLVNGRSSEQV